MVKIELMDGTFVYATVELALAYLQCQVTLAKIGAQTVALQAEHQAVLAGLNAQCDQLRTRIARLGEEALGGRPA